MTSRNRAMEKRRFWKESSAYSSVALRAYVLRVWCDVYGTDEGESRDNATARERYDVASVAVVDGRVAPLQRRVF